MAIRSLKDLYFDELGDLYDAETQLIRLLPRLAEAAHAPELREALLKHRDESRLHLERLQLIFTHWGERLSPRPCAGLAGIVQEADERLNEPATADARDAAIIGAAQRVEHYEMAAYGCARTYARRLNRADEARLLQETLDEEGRSDHRLTEIAEAHVIDDARMETDFDDEPEPRLRFVSVDQLDYSRLSTSPLTIVSDLDEELGTLDGLILDANRRPQYIVVHARGVFTGRRYLVPVAHVRFDDRSRRLRVNLSKEISARYPAFDLDGFGRMDDAQWRGYEASLLEFFPRADSGAEPQPLVEGEQPEWLMTGVWITLPPDRAEKLSDAARNFANEFRPVSGGGEDRGEHPRERMIAHDREKPR